MAGWEARMNIGFQLPLMILIIFKFFIGFNIT